jgi:adenylate kinase family enzyme
MSADLIINRLEEYEEKTLAVADFYKKQQKFASVDAVGDEEAVFDRLNEKVEVAIRMVR